MAQLIYGDRIAKTAKLQVGATAILFNDARDKLLCTRRTDNGRWCLPGGGMDPGEDLAETCVREMKEETGLDVAVKRLIGIYSSPHYIAWYDKGSGDKVQIVSAVFEVELLDGELTLSNETTEFGYFSPEEIKSLDFMENQRDRVTDAFAQQKEAFIR